MSSLKKILIFLILGVSLYASPYYKIILEYDKDQESLKSSLSMAKELSKGYNIEYHIEQFGLYRAITISPIGTIEMVESLYLLFRPHFPDIFMVTYQNNQKVERAKETTLMIESIKKIDRVKRSDILEYLKGLQQWLDKWYILIIIALLGLYFYYRRVIKISDIQDMQSEFSKEQDKINL
jgi:hypothetical protein